tara:strand:+ start:112 stop:216 length:105 start_codon:yes stop_codon:yes gene_type:complete
MEEQVQDLVLLKVLIIQDKIQHLEHLLLKVVAEV